MTADETDYISGDAGETDEVGLTDATDPTSSVGHIIHTYLRRGGGAQAGDADVFLMQGATQVATYHITGTTTPTDYTYTLSGPEADSITDYTDLRLRFVHDTGTTNFARIFQAWLEIPDAGGGGDATASPGVIAATATLPASSLSAGTSATPAAIAATSALPSASKSGGTSVTPVTLAALTSHPASAASAGSSSAPDNIAVSVSLPAAEASTSGDAQAQPVTIAVITALPAASASGATSISPGVITVLASLPQSSVPLDASVTPGLIQLVASVFGATASGATYVFRTPTYEVAHGTGSLWGRITFERGFSVLKLADGSYEQKTGHTAEDVADASIFYQGGREHIVSESEKDDLEAAGFTVDTL